MQDILRICLVQNDTCWNDIAQNLSNIEQKITALQQQTDLIVLPEMFSTGFNMKPNEIAETTEGLSITWMKDMAKKHNTAICGSLIIEENQLFFNRFVCAFANGTSVYYDKKHLFTLGGEHNIYTAGSKQIVFDLHGWKIAPFICYDLRFPVWSRNTQNYDLAIYTANWPKPRSNAWNSLLKARAIENMCYTVGVNRVGIDQNGYEYNGQSQIVDPLGEVVVKAETATESVILKKIEAAHLIENRNKFRFLNDQDTFELK